MPVGETIADYLRGRKAEQRTSRNDTWSKLMDAATMGSDIWKTLSGRKYGTEERVAGQDFAAGEADKARTHAVSMQEDAQLWGTGERLGGETYDAAQAALDRAARLLEAKANKPGNEGELNRRMNEALATVTTLNPDFTIPDPNNPNNSIIDLRKAKDIKDAVLAYFEDPAEKAWAERQFDLTIARYKPGATDTTQGGAKDYTSIFKQIAANAKNIASPSYDTGGVTTKSWAGPESALEAELKSMIPQLQGEDKEYAQVALNMSANPGKLGKVNYDMLYKVAQYLKTKLAPVVPLRPPTGRMRDYTK